MKKYDGILRLIIALICCISVIITGITNNIYSFKSKNSGISSEKLSDKTLFFPEEYKLDIPPKNKNDDNTESTSSTSSNTPSIIPTSGQDTAKGKIIEKFITPYTANTSYNNVYLKNNTGLSINLKDILNSSIGFKIEKNKKPQVLIMHTHTTESFMLEERDYYTEKDKSRTTDEKYNNVKLGEIVAKKLNDSGIVTLHDKTTHDYPEYNGSYTRSAATVKKYLKEYPSIKIVIDMHRDAVTSGQNDKVKLVTEINQKKAAQIMLVMGSQSGSITNHPNWKENLKLAVKLQQTLEVKYPTLARSILFCSRNYNQSLTTGSMLIEIGTDANTIEEVSYSAELLGNALTELLNRLE